MDVIVTQHHGRPSTHISRKPVVLGCIVAGFGSFWLVLLVLKVVLGGFVGGFGWFWMVLGGFGSFWVVLGGFGWFRVLVTTREGPLEHWELHALLFSNSLWVLKVPH